MLQHILFTPKGYGADGETRWPLMLFLHGAGERGNDLVKLRKYGPPKMVLEDSEFPFLLVAPQCPIGSYWHSASLLQLLDRVIKVHAVDESRIYITGVSMGGYGAWQLAADEPGRFAAIAPICGGGDPRDAPRIKDLPVWAFHGDQDDIVPLSETLKMVDAIRRAGGNPKVTIYPGVGHDSWTSAYAEPDLFSWFLSHARASGGTDAV
ncbi:MAG: phospholipase [Verrucomicrobiaceae bacterium]|nr:MAG: phospholipase [Verrucomicrobiaceae bacterium]